MNKKTKINLKDIDEPSHKEQWRVGGTDQAHVNEIAQSYLIKGQVYPISLIHNSITGRYKIDDGIHRFQAAKQVGWSNIDAILVSHANDLERDLFRWQQNDDHLPNKSNTKEELKKLIRRTVFKYKCFGKPVASEAFLTKVVDFHKKRTQKFTAATIRATAKSLLSGCEVDDREGTHSYLKGMPATIKAIKEALDGKWDGTSVKSVSQGWLVQCISQDSDVTIKPGTSLVQKFNTGAKSAAVLYVAKVEGLSDSEIDERRTKWAKKIISFGEHMKENSGGKIKPFDKLVILPQKDCEIKNAVRRLEFKNNRLLEVY